MVINNDPAVTVENPAARSRNRELFDPIAFGGFAIEFGLLNLQLPEAGDQKNENAYREILKRGHFARGETWIVASDPWVINFVLKLRIEKTAQDGIPISILACAGFRAAMNQVGNRLQ